MSPLHKGLEISAIMESHPMFSGRHPRLCMLSCEGSVNDNGAVMWRKWDTGRTACTWTRADSAAEPDNAGCATPPEVRQKPHIRITSKARAQQSAYAQVRYVGRTRRYSLFLAGEIPVEDTKSLVLEATRFVIHFTHGSGTVCPRSQPQSYQETKTDEASLEMEA